MSSENKSALLQALRTIEALEARFAANQSADRDPIAIVGIGCRFAGGANDPASFWKLIRDGVDATRELPEGRWNSSEWLDSDPNVEGKLYTDRGGYLDADPALFDAEFFGVSPREAAAMDPQQRLLLRVAWESLEDAHIPPDGLRESETGVYIGLMTNDYARLQVAHQSTLHDGLYLGGGTGLGFPAGRLSYTLGLHGPSMVVATECSSSLVAMHLAANALRSGECGLALAGGVNLILSPEPTVMLSRMRALAPDGRSKSFAAGADGYGRGEGCGVVVLQRLADAQRDGRRIYAVLHGSATNHDGPSGGLTIPNGKAQEKVIRKALAAAGVQAAAVGYVEAHGTGTALGDPIEVRALGNIWSEAGTRVLTGSVKTNIGHTEAAAGIAGVIKTALALHHGTVPASLHSEELSRHVAWDTLPVSVSTAAQGWPGAAPHAGVSSFGLSGINAHAVLGRAPENKQPSLRSRRTHQLLTVSARSAAARAELAGQYAKLLESGEDWNKVAATAARGRSHLEYRLAVNASSGDEAIRLLRGSDNPRKLSGRISARPEAGAAFLFTGQGSQYECMALALYETESFFRETLDRCAAILQSELPKPLLEVLFPTPGLSSPLDLTTYTQPALFAIEYSLAQLWMRWGLRPAYVIGHSVGELAAACIAGVVSLEDGLRFTARRARLMGGLPTGRGAMAVVFADSTRVGNLLNGERAVAVAAINGPANVALSGECAALGRVLDRFEKAGVGSRMLNVSHAFHSPELDTILPDLEAAAREMRLFQPSIPFASGLTGVWAGPEITTARYWVRQARETVRFSEALNTLYGAGCRTFLEVGPKAVLAAQGAAVIDDADCLWLPSLTPGKPDAEVLNQSAGLLYVEGFGIDWRMFYADQGYVKLPLYPFQEKRFWIAEHRRAAARDSNGTLLGVELQSPLALRQFDSTIGVVSHPWLGDHRANGDLLLPAAAYLEMALTQGSLADVSIDSPCLLPGDVDLRFQTIVDGDEIAVYSRTNDEWTRHCRCTIAKSSIHHAESLSAVVGRVHSPVNVGDFYADARTRGVDYGPEFRGIRELWRSNGEALARISGNRLTTVLDAVLQTAGAVLHEDNAAFIPVAISHVAWFGGVAAWAHARSVAGKSGGRTFDYTVYDVSGGIAGEIRGLFAQLSSPLPLDWLYKTKWEPEALEGSCEVQVCEVVAAADAEARRWDLRSYRAQQQALNARASHWMAKAAAEVQEHEVMPEHRRLYERLISATIGDASAETSAAFEIVDRCGAALPSILRGTADPLALLFPNNGLASAATLYETDLASLAANSMAREALSAIVAQQPPGRKIRVLEAGGGTGGTTPHLLGALPAGRTEYWFTDVSSFFTEKAKEKFRGYGFLRTAVFDVTRDPDEQGLGTETTGGQGFDVVVAANVIHAVPDVSGALRNLFQLVAPGGVLLLIEATEPSTWLDCTFGLTEGWWNSTDGREHPLMTAPQWCDAALTCGFNSASAHGAAGQSLMVASKAASADRKRLDGQWLVLADRRGIGDELARVLRADGCDVLTVSNSDNYRRIDADHFEICGQSSSEMQLFAMEHLVRPFTGVVYLWGLDVTEQPDTSLCLPLLNLLRNLVRNETLPQVWIATQGAVAESPDARLPGWDQAQLWGLALAARLEHPALELTCLDLDDPAAHVLYREIASGSAERHVAYRGHDRLVGRLTRMAREKLAARPADSFRLATSVPGDLDALELRSDGRRLPGPGEIEIEVRAAGLNFLDVLDALGSLPFHRGWFGGECSGIVSNVGAGVFEFKPGDEVVALAEGAFGTFVIADARVAARKPRKLSFAEAAAFPIVFLTAQLALAGVRGGQKVLIHAVSGGTGMAAWQLAQRAGAEVFGTASPIKWDRLRTLGFTNLMNSRSASFSSEVMARTRGAGVDVMLNALTGDFIPAGLRALAPGGVFLEIGKSEIWSPAQVAHVRGDVVYKQVDLFAYSQENPTATGAMLRELAAAFDEGSLKAVPVTQYPIERGIAAFRSMQGANHLGKIVLTIDSPSVQSEGTYLIVGGSSGLGLLTAEWLAGQGARQLILASRRASEESMEPAVSALRKRGCHVTVAALDISDREALRKLLEGRSLRGVVHAAGLLDDGLLAELEWSRFSRVLAPKVSGLWNLHELTRDMPLDFFVAYSSIASVLGSAGQTNHAAANAFVDALIAWRRSNGLPGLCINWGPWAELGGAARLSAAGKERQRHSGIGTISTRRGTALLDYLWRQQGNVTVVPIDWEKFGDRVTGQPFFREFHSNLSSAAVVVNRDGVENLLLRELRAVLGQNELWLPDEEQGFFGLGMDSLTSLELRNRLERALGLKLPVTLLFDHPSPARLTAWLTELIAPSPVTPALSVSELDGLEEQDLAALLEARLASMEQSA